MIDHQYSMACKDTPQAASNGETVTAPADASVIPDPLAAKHNFKKWSATPKYLFESRGAAALKAALKERNKLKISQLPPSQPVPPSLYEQKALRLAQRLKERKRSPKNNVLFTDPLVTKHYEYEPEYDGYVRCESSPALKLVAVYQKAAGSNKAQVTKVGSPPLQQQQNASQDLKMEVTKTKRSAVTNSIDDDDDDDELYILAPSDEMDLHADKLLQMNKANKRLRDSSEESGEERLIKSNSASGGLFSSPKVAKIAPYFEVEDVGEEKSRRAILHNRYKQTIANHRSRNTAHTQNDGQQSGYLGWLSTFLSNQLNKLIF